MKLITTLLYIIIVFYNIVDFIQTKMLLDFGCVEMNPLLNYFINVTGSIYCIAVIKFIWLVILFVSLILFMKRNK